MVCPNSVRHVSWVKPGCLVFRAVASEQNRLSFSALAVNERVTSILAVLESAVGRSQAVFVAIAILEDRSK